MRDYRQAVLALLLLLVVGSFGVVSDASAVDLVRISVASSGQASRAEAVFGSAVARHGNSFVVAADRGALNRWNIAGNAFETLLTNVDLDRLYTVCPTRNQEYHRTVDLDLLGTRVSLGDGRYLMQLSRATAASVAASLQSPPLPRCDRSVPFRYFPPAVSSAVAADDPRDILADLVDQDSLYAFNKRLEDFYTRYVFTDSIDLARDWLVDKFEGFGYDSVYIQPFWHSSWAGTGLGYNVVAVKLGYAEPDQVSIIGGHYDSYTVAEPWICAPGADDNGSGTAVTMEVARVLADVPLRKTVIFMAFSAEEQWMYGSGYAADQFAAAETKLEVMANYDMVGYTGGSDYDVLVHSTFYDMYRAVTAAAAYRVTGINPVDPGYSIVSDNLPFEDLGYPTIRVEESLFNTPNYHMESDLCSQLDFPYMADVARMATVSTAIIADAPYPAVMETVADVGDGQALEAIWSDCSADCGYMVYWGEQPGVYTDSAEVPAGLCSYTINGLQDGITYYALAVGLAPDGLRAMYGVEGSGVPYLYPHMPGNLTGSVQADPLCLTIRWDANSERDLAHYNIYRRYGAVGARWLYVEGMTATEFTDTDVLPHVGYEYSVTAVDIDGYESPHSDPVMLYPPSFDGGPVVVDGFVQDHSYDPDQAWQEAWLDSLFGDVGFALAPSDEHGGPVTLNDIGQYSTLIWIDDDVIEKNIVESDEALESFAARGENIMISGYQTLFRWASKSVPTSHLLFREFGLAYYDYTAYFDFIGAHGQNGWPSVEIDPARGMNEWRDIPKLTPRSGATVIATFDSFMDLPAWEGEPVGLAYETANGRRVLLSFPLYYLTPASAQALMARVFEYFGSPGQFDKGDLDHSGTIDIGDLVLLLDHLFINRRPLPDPEAADMDARPGVSIGDVLHLINYLFLDGPLPAPADHG